MFGYFKRRNQRKIDEARLNLLRMLSTFVSCEIYQASKHKKRTAELHNVLQKITSDIISIENRLNKRCTARR